MYLIRHVHVSQKHPQISNIWKRHFEFKLGIQVCLFICSYGEVWTFGITCFLREGIHDPDPHPLRMINGPTCSPFMAPDITPALTHILLLPNCFPPHPTLHPPPPPHPKKKCIFLNKMRKYSAYYFADLCPTVVRVCDLWQEEYSPLACTFAK